MSDRLVGITLLVAAICGLLPACEVNTYQQGQAIYEYKCANCHQPDGSGLIGNIPPLAQADWLVLNRDEIMCSIRYGVQGPMTVNGLEYQGVMQGYPELSPTEAVNVANYILTAWGNDQQPLPASRAHELIDGCGDRETIKLGNPQQLQ